VALVGLVLLAVAFGVLSDALFVNPSVQSIDTVQRADAIVVFVGGPDRIETGLELMERGLAENLVIPNGRSDDVDAADVCDGTSFQVFCPMTETVDTRGEARLIGQLARDNGWSSLIAVTSDYHVHRATSQLQLCHAGPIQAVESDPNRDWKELLASVAHEWVGTIAAMTVQRAC